MHGVCLKNSCKIKSDEKKIKKKKDYQKFSELIQQLYDKVQYFLIDSNGESTTLTVPKPEAGETDANTSPSGSNVVYATIEKA